ncbi:MAG TPA: Fic family protein [Candidatus Paceibacterota bacterium]|jgi:Fic family protein|nr:Fic family protein [Candidatus Paceibacterota bacterium]
MSNKEEIPPAKVKKLPPKISRGDIVDELAAAHSAVGELRGLLSALPNPDILIAPFRKREAVASSAIEGTRATLEDVLKVEASEKPEPAKSDTPAEAARSEERFQDVLEILNYERAMEVALKELKNRPIGENLLKKTHAALLRSVRGADKDPGNFRKKQVRVGDYIPPVYTELSGLMSNWEEYLNTELEKDPLVRIAVAHYQFEAIHPFSDGNGRIGRLIIPLFLCQADVLPTPVLYVSYYFEQFKTEYQRLLHRVDTHQEWLPWVRFFLTATAAQARMTGELATKIQELYEKLKIEKLPNIRSRHAITVLDLLFRQQIISANNVRDAIRANSKNTPYNLLEKFVEIGILRPVHLYGREKFYRFEELLKIVRA